MGSTTVMFSIVFVKKVRLVDAKFLWTEPHSKRIKVQLSVQAEVTAGTILQQGCAHRGTFLDALIRSQVDADAKCMPGKEVAWVTHHHPLHLQILFET